MDVFISYSTSDRDFAERLARELRSRGLTVWFDRWEIRVGDSIVEKIGDGISAADALVVVLSALSVQSAWVREELNAATVRSLQEKNILLLPVLREPCDIPALLRHRRYADFTSDYTGGLFDLLEAVLPLHRLWLNLAEIQRQHTDVITVLANADDREDVGEQVKLLYNLMAAAVDVRLEIENRQALAESPASSASLFDKITMLAERGIDLRSQTWYRLVDIRSAMAHQLNNDYGVLGVVVHRFAELDDNRRAREILRDSLGRLSDLMAMVAKKHAIDEDWYTRKGR